MPDILRMLLPAAIGILLVNNHYVYSPVWHVYSLSLFWDSNNWQVQVWNLLDSPDWGVIDSALFIVILDPVKPGQALPINSDPIANHAVRLSVSSIPGDGNSSVIARLRKAGLSAPLLWCSSQVHFCPVLQRLDLASATCSATHIATHSATAAATTTAAATHTAR